MYIHMYIYIYIHMHPLSEDVAAVQAPSNAVASCCAGPWLEPLGL